MRRVLSTGSLALTIGLALAFQTRSVSADGPNVTQVLQLRPVQADVEYDSPAAGTESSCKVELVRAAAGSGWELKGPGGVTLRRFLDTNGDNVVDRWSYFRQGLEVYRDTDSNYNGRADQSRWMQLGGTRWGIDQNEDGRIDAWRVISAEEASREIVRALAARDFSILQPLLLTENELAQLRLPQAEQERLRNSLRQIGGQFQATLAKLSGWNDRTRWVRLDASMPSLIPADALGTAGDLVLYQNAMVLYESGTRHEWLQIGELIRLGEVWKLAAVPQPIHPDQPQAVANVGLIRVAPEAAPAAQAGGSPELQKLKTELSSLDQASSSLRNDPKRFGQYHRQRAELIDRIAAAESVPEERQNWLRQQIDSLSAALQSGAYPEAAEQLDRMAGQVAEMPGGEKLASYAAFRKISAAYSGRMDKAGPNDFQAVQKEWMKELEAFAEKYPRADDAPDAILQLAVAKEFSGDEKGAHQWFERLTRDFPNAPQAQKAAGALRRMDLVGQPIDLRGASLNRQTIDTRQYRGKVLLLSYWATWCEPCKNEIPRLKQLYKEYRRQGFEIVGVSLDNNPEDLARFVRKEGLDWAQIFEPGGLESRPATYYGIVALPSMILVDRDGKVLNRSIHMAELETELEKLFKKK